MVVSANWSASISPNPLYRCMGCLTVRPRRWNVASVLRISASV